MKPANREYTIYDLLLFLTLEAIAVVFGVVYFHSQTLIQLGFLAILYGLMMTFYHHTQHKVTIEIFLEYAVVGFLVWFVISSLIA